MKVYVRLTALWLLITAGCSVNSFRTPEPAAEPAVDTAAPYAARLTGSTPPLIKVGLIKGAASLVISAERGCRLTGSDGSGAVRLAGGCTWRAEVTGVTPGSYIFLLVAASMSSQERAEVKAAEIRARGFETFVYENGANRQTRGGGLFRVCIKQKFDTLQAARDHRDAVWNALETFIIRFPVTAPGGTIRLTDIESGRVSEYSRTVILQGSGITLHDVPVGIGFHWENRENRRYGGEIILQVDDEGAITVINRLDLEEYLKGVVPSEMPAGFPREALKAQAIAARSEVLYKLGKAHLDDSFDVCADVHCQVFSGLGKRTDTTDRAVDDTRGRVITYEGEVIDAVYSAVCGGHTENSGHAWGGSGLPYLTGRYVGGGSLRRYGSLTSEKNARRWIDADPAAACNTTRGRIVKDMEYTKKYFRWEQTLRQDELRASLFAATGTQVGSILAIVPLVRGESGRIISLKIEGSSGSYIIKGELKIRRALKKSTLWSSCFYVRKGGSRRTAPNVFILAGAGFGHGVGMCQTGAAGLALRGADYRRILGQYYRGTRIRRMY